MFITADLCVLHWLSLCVFSLCIFYFPTPFLWFWGSFILIMCIWCLLFSQFRCVLFSCPYKHLCCLLTFPPLYHVEYSSLSFWCKTAGALWKPTWVYFFIPFFIFLKIHYHEEPEILSWNFFFFFFFCWREFAGEYKPFFFPGFLLFCIPPPPNPISHHAFSLEVRILPLIFVSFLRSVSSSYRHHNR